MFYIIGLGLGDPKDITVKGLEIVKKCEKVYLEEYTSIMTGGKAALEEFYGRRLLTADRYLVEQGADEILMDALNTNVALLVVGDPFGATTHTDFLLRAKSENIPVEIVHNTSIFNAIGCCGLQLYNFGATISIPYWTESWKPDSFYDKIKSNIENNLHTLCLLDIKVKEPTIDSIMKKKIDYQPPRFMSVSEAASQLLEIIENKNAELKNEAILPFTKNTMCIGLARIGHKTQFIKKSTLSEMQNIDMGPPLHSLIIPAKTLHPLEEEFLQKFID